MLTNASTKCIHTQDNQKRFLEDPDVKRRFLEYRRRTSPLIPFPPSLYADLPMWMKRWLFLELSMYETDWAYGAPLLVASSNNGSEE